ncbi:hypothetical protein [Citrobacter portucalensis]|uniref:hypothetical protein n=1 Tax=Citrobacter portucalensis TaxID=1639133 RepID=UPI001930AE49|nr:hypothetical protein [Citrobacter portucalensis]
MKNLATWLLAAAFTTAALPAFAVEPSVQVGYSPEGGARFYTQRTLPPKYAVDMRVVALSLTPPQIMKKPELEHTTLP